jgi:sugar phosphate isomerase/epimerase
MNETLHASLRDEPVDHGVDDLPQFAVSQCSTWHSTFEEDMRNYNDASIQGIGLWEFKLAGDDAASRRSLEAAGLIPTICWPRVPGPLPVDPLFPGPSDAAARTMQLCSSIRRLASFKPLAVACVAEGAIGDRTIGQARAVAVASLREAAIVAGEEGVRLALEVIRPRPSGAANLTTTITDALGIIHDVGVDTIDVLIDTWHIWDAPSAPDEIAAYGENVIAVQVNDYPSESRGTFDRAIPGQGSMPLPAIFSALEASAFKGPYEMEIFSGGGPIGTRDEAAPEVRDATGMLVAAREGFSHAWAARGTAGVWAPSARVW